HFRPLNIICRIAAARREFDLPPRGTPILPVQAARRAAFLDRRLSRKTTPAGLVICRRRGLHLRRFAGSNGVGWQAPAAPHQLVSLARAAYRPASSTPPCEWRVILPQHDCERCAPARVRHSATRARLLPHAFRRRVRTSDRSPSI